MSKDLLISYPYTATYSTHHNLNYFKNYNSKGEAVLSGNITSLGSEYIPINPTGKTYYYDAIISVNTGNMFYIGFERYDEDFTPRSNNACVYAIAFKPTSDIVYQRYTGTINLATDGVNPCAYIALRVLNGWSGTTSGVTGQATIHYLSLREVTTSVGFANTQILKTGIVNTDTFIDKNDKCSIEKKGYINTIDFIEI